MATIRELRTLARDLGITAKSAGMAIDELVEQARGQDDPAAFLRTFAPAPTAEPTEYADPPETPAATVAPAEATPGTDEPSGDSAEIVEPAGPLAAGDSVAAPPGDQPTVEDVTVQVPFSVTAPARAARTVELRLAGPQAVALARVRAALVAGGERLARGKVVRTPADALAWLLEQIALPPA